MQILLIITIRNVWGTVRRTCVLILELKGLKNLGTGSLDLLPLPSPRPTIQLLYVKCHEMYQ